MCVHTCIHTVCIYIYTYKIRTHPYVYIEWCLEEGSMSDVFFWFAWDGPTFGHGLLVTCCDAEGTDCCSGSQADFSCRGLAAHDAEMTWSLLGVLLQGIAFLKWQVDAGKWAQNWFAPPITMVIWGMVCYCFTHINQFAFACRYLGLHRTVRPIFQQSSTISGWLIIVYPPRSMGFPFQPWYRLRKWGNYNNPQASGGIRPRKLWPGSGPAEWSQTSKPGTESWKEDTFGGLDLIPSIKVK